MTLEATSEFHFEGKHIDVLHALIKRGPLEDGDIPSKSGRDDLVAMRCVVRLNIDGTMNTFITPEGKAAYSRHHVGSILGVSDKSVSLSQEQSTL